MGALDDEHANAAGGESLQNPGQRALADSCKRNLPARRRDQPGGERGGPPSLSAADRPGKERRHAVRDGFVDGIPRIRAPPRARREVHRESIGAKSVASRLM